jgi:GST-like protein
MEDLSWDARMKVKNPDRIQLYSAATPNGIKVAAALEEIRHLRSIKEDFNYEPHIVNLRMGETRQEKYRQFTPTGKIPVICDPHGPNGKPHTIFESGAILLYLAEKYHELIPEMDPGLRIDTIKWLFWGSTAVSSQFKLFGFYYKYCTHDLPYCQNRYAKECNRLLEVLERQLEHGKDWVVGGKTDLF